MIHLACSRMVAAEQLGWEQWLQDIRAGTSHAPVAIYLGSCANHLPRLLAAGDIHTHGIAVITVQADDRITNPLSLRPMDGAQLQTFLGATAGTLVFLDHEGLPLPQLSMPQAMHGDDPQLFDAYFSYVAGGHYRTMTIAEYCAALGTSSVISRAVARVRHGFSGRPLSGNEPLVPAVEADGHTIIDPWTASGVFYIYAHHAQDRVFLAQLEEISHAFGSLQPRVTVIVPDQEQPPLPPAASAGDWVLGHAAPAELARLAVSPVTIVTARGAHGMTGMRLDGFQPAAVLAQLLGLPLPESTHLNHDIPYAEADPPEDLASLPQATP